MDLKTLQFDYLNPKQPWMSCCVSELDLFRSNGGERPDCSVTLCFGEELNNTEDPTSKLIIVKVKLQTLTDLTHALTPQ